MAKLKDLQGPVHFLTAELAAISTAGTTAERAVGRAPFRCQVVGAYFVAESTITGAATNNRKLDLVNKGAAGAGTAVAATITFTAAIVGTAYDSTDLTVSATDTDVQLADGDVVSIQSLVNGSGLAQPAGTIVVAIQAR